MATALVAVLVLFAVQPARAALLDLSDVTEKFHNFFGTDSDEFGRGLASGDFNGDGYPDLAAGAISIFRGGTDLT
jgi:hypothetical protein